jgi:hypothetical protein
VTVKVNKLDAVVLVAVAVNVKVNKLEGVVLVTVEPISLAGV